MFFCSVCNKNLKNLTILRSMDNSYCSNLCLTHTEQIDTCNKNCVTKENFFENIVNIIINCFNQHKKNQ